MHQNTYVDLAACKYDKTEAAITVLDFTYSGYLTSISPLSTKCEHKSFQKDWREELTEHILLITAAGLVIASAIGSFAAGLGFRCFCCFDILLCFIPLR